MAFPLTRVADGDWRAVNRVIESVSARLDVPVPQARVYNSANISITTSGTRQFLTFDSEVFDNGSLHSTSANTSRLTAPVTGLYLIGAQIEFASNATGYREVDLVVNGATFIAVQRWPAVNGATTLMNANTIYHLSASDYVEVGVVQTTGGALNVTAGTDFSPRFWMVRLAGFTGGQFT